MMKFVWALLIGFVFLATFSQAAEDSLDQVNSQRVARGLKPYLPDAGLANAAASAADYRAKYRIAAHTSNDFGFQLPGVHAACTGCACWDSGFGACELFGRWTYCGAAVKIGADGKRYCHCFYSNTPSAIK